MKFLGKRELSPEEVELDNLFREMQLWDKTDSEYGVLLARWMDLRKAIDESKARNKVKPDTWLIVGSNLLTVLAVLNHERLNTISTKALSFIKKI